MKNHSFATLLLVASACVARPGSPGWIPENPIDAALIAAETGLQLYTDVQADLSSGKDATTIYQAREKQGLVAVGVAELAERAGRRAIMNQEGQDAYQASMIVRNSVTELMGSLRSGAVTSQTGRFQLQVRGEMMKTSLGKLQFLNVRSKELRDELRAQMEKEATRQKTATQTGSQPTDW